MNVHQIENGHLSRECMSRRDFLRIGGAGFAGAFAGVTLLGTAGCGGGSGDSGEMTMWTRSAAEQLNQILVKEWNKTHDPKIKLTIIPNDQYVTKVSTSGASGDLPDLLSMDLIYMPQFNDKQIMADITDKVDALPFKDSLSPAHVELSEWEGAQYGVPYGIDNSALFYNKGLFEEAGLDPEEAPANWGEIESSAKEVDGLGGKVNGFYFAGNCGGCNEFTAMPVVWAMGGDTISGDGKQANFDSPEVAKMLEFYRGMVEQDLVPSSVKSDAGENWIPTFAAGNVGIMPSGSFMIAALKADAPDLEVGNGFLVGPDGSHASFGGGDVLGVTATSEMQDQAWEYIKWMLSEKTQVDIMSRNGFMVSRTDLAENEYASDLVQLMNRTIEVARTPKTLACFQLFNDPNGPWINMFNSAIFGGDIDGAMSRGQEQAQQVIDEAYG